MSIKSICLSWDTFISAIVTLTTAIFLPSPLEAAFALSFYGVGITVLSIVFSLFFAALTIIMSSSDNEFIEFLEESLAFTGLLNGFKVTLSMLFISLVYAIALYTATDFFVKKYPNGYLQPYYCFLIFEFLFCYSLTATALSVKDTMAFSGRRAKYLMLTRGKDKTA